MEEYNIFDLVEKNNLEEVKKSIGEWSECRFEKHEYAFVTIDCYKESANRYGKTIGGLWC